MKKRRSKQSRHAVREWLKMLKFHSREGRSPVFGRPYTAYSRAVAAMARLHVAWAQGDTSAQLRTRWRVTEGVLRHFCYRTHPPVSFATRLTGTHHVKRLAWLTGMIPAGRVARQRRIFTFFRHMAQLSAAEVFPQHAAQWLRIASVVRSWAAGDAIAARRRYATMHRCAQMHGVAPAMIITATVPARRSETSMRRRAHV